MTNTHIIMERQFLRRFVVLLGLMGVCVFAQGAQSLKPVPIQQVQVTDDFWAPKMKVWREVTIPDCFAKFEKDGAFANFDKVRDGGKGEHGGPPWYDGLVYEMIRGSADFLAAQRDPKLEAQIDGYIERISAAAAKDSDGYLNTYTQLKEPNHRWGLNGGNDVEQHDLYNAGCLVEAAVHYYRATGKTPLLQTAVRLANHMADLMGPPPKKNIVPGHALGEEAMVKLYVLFHEQPELKQKISVPVDEQRYLKLAEFWIENRGNHVGRDWGKFNGSYAQDHKPVLQQETIEGHAVRATLLCAGLVAAGNVNGREDYLTAAQRLWSNMVERRMYVIGGLGAIAGHEGFGPDYVLPNDGYLETCAAIGAGFFHHNLNLARGDARYADELERVLYNGVLSGVALKGDSYFYENPLQAGPDRKRWSWHGCPCCPPMFLKIMGALPGYLYAQTDRDLYVNLYAGSRAEVVLNGIKINVRQSTDYPWNGDVKIVVEPERVDEFGLYLRLPAWCSEPKLAVNGRSQAIGEPVRGYAHLQRRWKRGDVVNLTLPMPVQRVKANPKIEANVGRVAIQRGPLIYCLEAADNGGHVRNLAIPSSAELHAVRRADLLGSITTIQGTAQAVSRVSWPNAPYLPDSSVPGVSNVAFTAIPYYANANRQPGEMRVWMPEANSLAEPLADTQDARIEVHAEQTTGRVSRYLTGACIEDVNHEVYGGIDSQMIFGESFAEPAPPQPLKGFKVFGGRWVLGSDGSVAVAGSNGAKIISEAAVVSDGEVSVDLLLTESDGGNAGLIVKVNDAGNGPDVFAGYEISLERPGVLVLGRHRQNWEPLQRVPCEVPVNQWVTLTVRMSAKTLAVFVNGKRITQYEDTEHPLALGAVGLRTWQHDVRFRNFTITTEGVQRKIPFGDTEPKSLGDEVSGMWRGVRQGTATGSLTLQTEDAFSGKQSQCITLAGGAGAVGIENQSLNRWGMNFIKGMRYEGYLYVRCAKPTEFVVALESRDGERVYAERQLRATGTDWQRVDFNLEPNTTGATGRFTIKLKQPGTISIGYAFLQPGEWGRFKGLPVRKDVAQGLIDQGVTVLRQGGCMANAAEYRWKKMIGPRAKRSPYVGWWYPHSSNGWGIFEFLNFCEAAGFLPVPDVNCNETPADMADFIEYVNGPKDSKWGRQRVADGHPKSYGLKYLQIGNEEQVNESYWQKFKGIAGAIWARDPEIILVVGDFAYNEPIKDPFNFGGADSRITSLVAQQKILQLAKAHNREVWFDVHVNTDGPRPKFGGTFSYIDALEQLAEGAKHRVVIFEYNAGNHSQRRALANAAATIQVERDGRLPIVTSANCLQPDGQNDNDWDQGLLFLNPSKTWLQPPGYVTQMMSRNYQPLQVTAEAHGDGGQLEVSAKRSEDGKTVVVQVVNFSEHALSTTLDLRGFVPVHPQAHVEELTASLEAANTAEATERVRPNVFEWAHQFKDGQAVYRFAPHSFTVIRLQ